MRNCLTPGSELILKEKNTDNRLSVRIIEDLGAGAVCIAYLAEDISNKGLRYIVKECCPINGASRESEPEVVWNDDETENEYQARFTKAYEMQLGLQNNSATSNDMPHITHGLLEANKTLYMLIDPRSAVSYDDPAAGEKTLQEVFRTAKALSEAIGAQHRAGYLNLDIKPSNMMIVPEKRESVLLLDFDSLVEKDAVLTMPSSYTAAFAAPEQLQHKLKRVSEATDIYAIGAVVFSRIFGRSLSSEDRSIFSDWNFEDNPLFFNLSSKVIRLTKELFHKTLAASPKCRFQSTSELTVLLDELITESDPKRRHLVSTCPDPINIFVGREEELCRIHDAFTNGKKLVCLTGMGGIGKTELAKNYAKRYKADYDVICFGNYRDSIDSLFKDNSFIHLVNDTEGITSFSSIRDLLNERVLLIIDNYWYDSDDPSDEIFDELLSSNCKLLVTTRNLTREIFESADEIDLSELDEEEQHILFEKEYGNEAALIPAADIDNLLKAIHGYTLLIPLVAKMLAKSSLCISEVTTKIVESGTMSLNGPKVYHKKDKKVYSGSINKILELVLDLSSLSREEEYVIKSVLIHKDTPVKKRKLCEWIGIQYEDVVNNLVDRHWISCKGSGIEMELSLHDVIYDIAYKKYPLIVDEIPWIKDVLRDYIKKSHDYAENNGFLNKSDYSGNALIERIGEIFNNVAALAFFVQARQIEAMVNCLDFTYICNVEVACSFYEKLFDDRISYAFNFSGNKNAGLQVMEKMLSHPDLLELCHNYYTRIYYIKTMMLLRDLLGDRFIYFLGEDDFCDPEFDSIVEELSKTTRKLSEVFETSKFNQIDVQSVLLKLIKHFFSIGIDKGKDLFLLEEESDVIEVFDDAALYDFKEITEFLINTFALYGGDCSTDNLPSLFKEFCGRLDESDSESCNTSNIQTVITLREYYEGEMDKKISLIRGLGYKAYLNLQSKDEQQVANKAKALIFDRNNQVIALSLIEEIENIYGIISDEVHYYGIHSLVDEAKCILYSSMNRWDEAFESYRNYLYNSLQREFPFLCDTLNIYGFKDFSSKCSKFTLDWLINSPIEIPRREFISSDELQEVENHYKMIRYKEILAWASYLNDVPTKRKYEKEVDKMLSAL